MMRRSKLPRVFRWDLDKTYLVSDFDRFRDLVRVPFQKAEDKDSFAPRVYSAPWGCWDEVFFISYPVTEM